MDLSKTTLQDLDINKTEKLVNENKKQDIFIHDSSTIQANRQLMKEQNYIYDFSNDIKVVSDSSEVKSCDDMQNAIDHKQIIKTTEMHNSKNRNDNVASGNVAISSNISDVSNLIKGGINNTRYNKIISTSVGQDSEAEKINHLEGESKESSVLYPQMTLCDKRIVVNELNNVNMLHSTGGARFLEKTEKNIEKVVGLQTEMKKVDLIDEVETIEKIAEMIAISSKVPDGNNANLKKRLQILMPRTQPLQNCNSSDDSSASGTNICRLQINEDNVDHNETKSLNDQINKKRNHATDSSKTFYDLGNGTAKSKNNEISEENFLEKKRFEEVEDKLEEMFAGIEEEHLGSTASDHRNVPEKPNKFLNKYIKDNSNGINDDLNNELLLNNSLKCDASTSNKKPLPTKAAKKSTTSLNCTENSKQLNLQITDYENPSLCIKAIPPQRRLSVGISKKLLNFSIKTCDEIYEKKGCNDIIRERGITRLPLNLQTRREVKHIIHNVPKNKIKNNPRKCPKYKNDRGYVKSNNCSNKRIIRKSEAPIKTKQIQHKIKNLRMQHLLSSENDNEDKQLQTRDGETKNRSPFVLVKNNGSIAVVNNVTPDDSNERLTRSKKANNYVHERKTVKGCHSSTLSNKYDADTADSSWKCVFCKIGPHKKGLGDLFGPYVISSDCDEYRSTKDSLEKFQKFRRNDTQFLNFSNKSVKFIKDTSKSHVQNTSDCHYEQLINIYTLQMSQVSVDCYEVWVHEECAIWAPNIFVVGSRLVGLQEDTWNSLRYECVYCLKEGALLCCLQRNCNTTSHVPCAREYKWLLDESKFWVYCTKHALK